MPELSIYSPYRDLRGRRTELSVLFYGRSHSSKTAKSKGFKFDQAVAALLFAVSAPLREPIKGLRAAPKRLLSNDGKANRERRQQPHQDKSRSHLLGCRLPGDTGPVLEHNPARPFEGEPC